MEMEIGKERYHGRNNVNQDLLNMDKNGNRHEGPIKKKIIVSDIKNINKV